MSWKKQLACCKRQGSAVLHLTLCRLHHASCSFQDRAASAHARINCLTYMIRALLRKPGDAVKLSNMQLCRSAAKFLLSQIGTTLPPAQAKKLLQRNYCTDSKTAGSEQHAAEILLG